MSTNGKDVIYIDVDDEITGIIDKVTSAQAKIVAVVLPKRANVFQSVVNMKLLKRRAEAAKKQLVLITSETSLMPLAGSVGLYVAKTLQSKPEIPEMPAPDAPLDDVGEAVPVDGGFDPDLAKDKPIGDLAVAASGVNAAAQMPEETIELDNTDAEPPAPAAGSGGKDVAALAAGGATGKAGKHGKSKKDKKLKVPNFNRFRILLMLGGLVLILLVAAWYVAFNILPTAAVTITTSASSINSTPTLTLDTNATNLNETADTLPAQTQQRTQRPFNKTRSNRAGISRRLCNRGLDCRYDSLLPVSPGDFSTNRSRVISRRHFVRRLKWVNYHTSECVARPLYRAFDRALDSVARSFGESGFVTELEHVLGRLNLRMRFQPSVKLVWVCRKRVRRRRGGCCLRVRDRIRRRRRWLWGWVCVGHGISRRAITARGTCCAGTVKQMANTGSQGQGAYWRQGW